MNELSETGIFRNNIPGRSVIPEQRSGNFRFTGKTVPEIVPDFRNLFHNGNEKNFRIISVRKP